MHCCGLWIGILHTGIAIPVHSVLEYNTGRHGIGNTGRVWSV